MSIGNAGAVHMVSMNENSTAKAAFAPAWPSLYSTSYSAGSVIMPSYSRTRVFNHDLTTDQLKPLLEDCPVPGRELRRIGFWCAFGTYGLMFVLWLGFWATARLRGVHFDFTTRPVVAAADTASLDAGSAVIVGVMLAAAAVWLTGTVLNFVARKKWAAALIATWKLHDGHIVRTRDLPEERQQSVNRLGRLLDSALEALDANEPTAGLLNLAARAAIGRYFELPVTSEDERCIAQSSVSDSTVQQVRDTYEAATSTEKASLHAAEDAVRAVQDYVVKVKAAAADQEIINLAKAIAAAGASS